MSAVKWGPQLCTVANLTVTSEFPMGTRLSTLISNSPPPPLTQNLRITRRLPDLTEVPLWQPRAARPQVAFAVGSLQGLSAKNPLEPLTFPRPCFKQIKVLSSCWWKPEVQVKVNECGILKEAGRTSKDWVGPESFL